MKRAGICRKYNYGGVLKGFVFTDATHGFKSVEFWES
jgi:hypothetical protein